MELLLDPRAKTIPSNYSVKGLEVDLGETPGYSLTEDAMDKARRQESEYYDWKGYEALTNPVVEHPEYRSKGEAFALTKHWEEILKKGPEGSKDDRGD